MSPTAPTTATPERSLLSHLFGVEHSFLRNGAFPSSLARRYVVVEPLSSEEPSTPNRWGWSTTTAVSSRSPIASTAAEPKSVSSVGTFSMSLMAASSSCFRNLTS